MPRLDRDAERRAPPGGVLLDHQRDVELVETLSGHGQADQPPAVGRHEVDDLRRDELRRADEVAFVLAILVVQDDRHLPGTQVVQDVFDTAERGFRFHGVCTPFSLSR